MALNASLRKTVANAMKALTDLRSDVTYTAVAVGAYDPLTDTRSNAETSYTLKGVAVGLSSAEVGWFPADRRTEKLIVAGLDLPVTPALTDYVTIDGARWNIARIKQVPGNSVFILFIQEP